MLLKLALGNTICSWGGFGTDVQNGLDKVTCGTASASFLAIRSLHQPAKDPEQEYPISSQSIFQELDCILKLSYQVLTLVKVIIYWKEKFVTLLSSQDLFCRNDIQR